MTGVLNFQATPEESLRGKPMARVGGQGVGVVGIDL